MGLYEKVEEIRSKPEHIRIRYVWAMVAIVMFFVLIIWFFSLKSEQSASPLIPGAVTDQFQQQEDPLQNATGGITNVLQNNTSSNQQNSNKNQ